MNKHKYFFRGIGVALIVAASIFYFVGLSNKETSITTKHELNDSDIIARAKELGMVKQDDVVKEKVDLTDDEIITKARKLGMIFDEEIEKEEPNMNQNSETTNADNSEGESKQEDNKNDSSEKSNDEEENTEEETDESTSDLSSDEKTDSDDPQTVTLKITYGMASDDVAKLLYDNGVVDNIRAFDRYLIIHKYDQKIKTGSYDFELDSTYEEAMKIFTNK